MKPITEGASRRKMTRGEFLKIAGTALGFATLACNFPTLAPQLFKSTSTPGFDSGLSQTGQNATVDHKDGGPTPEQNPHTYLPLYAPGVVTGLLVNGSGTFKRAVPPPPQIQASLDELFEARVPWTGKPGKPDMPIGNCIINLPKGQGQIDLKLDWRKTVGLETSSEKPGSTPINPGTLSAVLDETTGTVFITTTGGRIIRVVPPPEYQQGLANEKYTAVYPYYYIGGKKPDGLIGDCVITTADGKKTTSALLYTNSVKII